MRRLAIALKGMSLMPVRTQANGRHY